ncbi:hypothetical protein ACTMTI_50650 [Nonomuraea sp. H19]|uniref:hypothetical protein n=1 Tax=Nonomuraea sp. H19 TaxID=3452206 RepID=UPI003F8A8638
MKDPARTWNAVVVGEDTPCRPRRRSWPSTLPSSTSATGAPRCGAVDAIVLEELHRLLKEKDQQTATINARAIPVLGAGIFLNGVPEALAEIPWHLGWLLPFLGFGAMVAALLGSRRSRT